MNYVPWSAFNLTPLTSSSITSKMHVLFFPQRDNAAAVMYTALLTIYCLLPFGKFPAFIYNIIPIEIMSAHLIAIHICVYGVLAS